MKMIAQFPSYCAIACLVAVFLCGRTGSMPADVGDDTREMEKITEETREQAEQPAARTPERQPEVVLPGPTRKPQPQISASAPAAARIAAPAEILSQKEKELAAAKKEIERLREYVKKILDQNRRERLAMHYNMGCAFRAAKDFKRAESEFRKALEVDPADAGTHYNLAILYDDDLRDKRKAKEHYEKFLEIAPDDKDAAKVREWLSSITMKIPEEK